MGLGKREQETRYSRAIQSAIHFQKQDEFSNINLKPVSSIHGTSHPLSGISSGGMRAVPPFVGFVPTTVAPGDTAAGIGSGDPVPYGSRFPAGNPVCCDRTDTYGVDPIITLHIVQFYLF